MALALLGLPAGGVGATPATLPQQSGQVDLLDEANLRIDGAAPNDQLESVAGAGDVNGDGRSDVIVATLRADNNGRNDSGSAYVVFGQAVLSDVDLAALGARGFRIDGAAGGDLLGGSAAGAGDVNGDGRADVIVGARGADNNARGNSGSAYVVFGQATPANLDLAALGARGFRIDGAAASHSLGNSVAGAGDVNGDGRADMIVSAPVAGNNGRAFSGSAYVVFGQAVVGNVDTAALGAAGFRIDGALAADLLGGSVAGGGDVNGDGRADVLVSASDADNNGRANSGSAYVVFGQATPVNLDLAAIGARGFRIDGAAPGDGLRGSVAGAGDVNGDGRADVVVSTPEADNNGRGDSGSAYVVFGPATAANLDLAALAGRGFRIDGAAASDSLGESIGGAGDVNGDGRADVIVGALGADNNGRGTSGSAYVVFGQAAPGDLDTLVLGTRGFRIDGAAASNFLGASVAAAGDVNGDGRADVVASAPGAGNNGRAASGSAYVVLGFSPPVAAASAVCKTLSPGPAASPGDPADITLTTTQLLINQRIDQAAIRRANGVQAWIDDGVEGRDLCQGALGAGELAAGIVTDAAGPAIAFVAPDPRPIVVAAAKPGDVSQFTLTTRQLLINQRISQAAIRRLNALKARMDTGLTGGDLDDRTLTQPVFTAGLRVLVAPVPASPPAASRTDIAPAKPGDPSGFTLTTTQLLINQRISQAAVRRANELIARIEDGLLASDVRAATVTALDLAPGVAP